MSGARSAREADRPSWDPTPGWVRVIAHRGGPGAPENTLAAFRAARGAGADGVELDVMRCHSGEVVVFHDPTLARLADRPERVDALPLAALREVRLGTEGIPLLAEALEELGPDLLVNVELKSETLVDRGLSDAVSEVLGRFDLGARLLVSSFNPLLLAWLRRLQPAVRTGLLVSQAPRAWLRERSGRALASPFALHPEAGLVDAVALARWRRWARAVCVWTVDDAAEMSAMATLGLDAIITNQPARARAILA